MQAPNNRKLKVGHLLKKELVMILNQNSMHISLLELIRPIITDLTLGNDLKIATVHLMPGLEHESELLSELNQAKGLIRKILAQRVQMRYVPDLIFTIDEHWEAQNKLDALLYGTISSASSG